MKQKIYKSISFTLPYSRSNIFLDKKRMSRNILNIYLILELWQMRSSVVSTAVHAILLCDT
jgi:hypothetical protein